MKKKINSFYTLLSTLLFAVSLGGGSQSVWAQPHTDALTALQAVKEVYLKGSLDGKSMYLVLGMEKAVENLRYIKNLAIPGEALVDAVQTAKDMKPVFNDAVKGTSEHFQNIIGSPWKSIQKSKVNFEVNFDHAIQGSEYYSQNPWVGSLNYAGWATWAYIDRGYYLIIEAPAKGIYEFVMTVASLPVRTTVQGLKIVYKFGAIGFKYALVGVAGVAMGTYSILSSTAATLVTLATAVAVATYHGAKWLFYELPMKLFYPVRLTYRTSLESDLYGFKQRKLARSLADHFRETADHSVNFECGKYASTMEVTAFGIERGIRVRVYPNAGTLYIQFEMGRNMLKAEKERNLETPEKEIKELVRTQYSKVFADLELEIIEEQFDPGTVDSTQS